MKLKKVIIVFSLIFIYMIFLNLGCIVHAETTGTLTRDIDAINDEQYPGYKKLIKDLKAKHSNYTFLAYYTGLDWNEVLVSEYQSHGISPLNLFQIGPNYNGMWQCPICGTKNYDNGSWCCASLEAIAYMMDPRNSINEDDIFQFKDLEGADASIEDIRKVVASYGSYLNNNEAIQAIYDASKEYNINPYFLVAKIVNEHGKNGSTLSNGQGYKGEYVGYYNYFNIGSFGNGTEAIINSGLAKAKAEGWNSIRASIFGGTAVVRESYITRYSQNTLYYQKFNVSGKSTLGSHQYQQNIMAAQTQGASFKKYYGASNSEFIFIIPIYEKMPKEACKRPVTNVQNTITYEDGIIQHVTKGLTLRASPGGTAIGSLSNAETVKIIKRATEKINNYYWDLILSNKSGLYGYAARYVGGDECIASTGSIQTLTGSKEELPPQNPVNNTTNTANNVINNNTTTNVVTNNTNTSVSSNNVPVNNAVTNTISKPTDNTTSQSGNFKFVNSYMKALPQVGTAEILKEYKDAKILDSKGNTISEGNLGTGYKVTIGTNTYTVVKKGDLNGDAIIDIMDAIAMLNSIKGTKTLENEFKQAALLTQADDFNILDVVKLLNFIKGTSKIEL